MAWTIVSDVANLANRAGARLEFWAGLCALLASASCANDAQGDTASPYEITGSVVDERTGHGLDGATISFSSDTLDRAQTASDGDGHFTLEVSVRDGVMFGIVSAAHPGYQNSATHSVYFDGSTHVIDLTLRPAAK